MVGREGMGCADYNTRCRRCGACTCAMRAGMTQPLTVASGPQPERSLCLRLSKRHRPSDCLRLTCKGNLQQLTRLGLTYRHLAKVARSGCDPGDANSLRHMDEQRVVLCRDALRRSAKLVSGRVPIKAEHGERTAYVARDPHELRPLQGGSDGQHARVVRFDFHA